MKNQGEGVGGETTPYPSVWTYITITNPAGDGGYFVPYDFYLEIVELKLLPPGWGIKPGEVV